jgi:hypothetical protein
VGGSWGKEITLCYYCPQVCLSFFLFFLSLRSLARSTESRSGYSEESRKRTLGGIEDGEMG